MELNKKTIITALRNVLAETEVQKLIDAGGKEWTKQVTNKTLHRIYLNRDAIIKFLNLDKTQLTDFEMKSLEKAKTFFDVDEVKYVSDVGTVRVLFNRHGVKCHDPLK